MSEASKIRWYLSTLYNGYFDDDISLLDIGCGDDPIFPWADTVDKRTDVKATVNQDITTMEEGALTYEVVFSSHTLEDIYDWKKALKTWISWIKDNGLLVLYLPHRYFYPNIGHPKANKAHKHDFIPGDIIPYIESLGCLLLEAKIFYPPDHVYSYKERGEIDYSFLIVAQKIDNLHEYPIIDEA